MSASAAKRAASEPPPFALHPKQIEVRDVLAGPEMHNLVYGGSRSGKTFLLTYATATRAILAPDSRHLIGRLHNIDVRQSVMMDTFPSVMKLAYPGLAYELNKSDQFVTFHNGSELWFGGFDDKERVEKILGKEYATIYVNEASQVAYDTILTLRTRLAQRAVKMNGDQLRLKFYVDLNPTGRSHWTHKEFVEGIRPDNSLPVRPGTRVWAVMNPDDNPNLPPEYLEELDALPERQRQRFKEGKYLSEVPGTLWPLDTLDKHRVAASALPGMQRIVVAIDPSGSDGTGGDSQGIVVAGLGVDGRGYVLADRTCRLPPEGWGRRAVGAYYGDWHEEPELWKADLLVAERNYGGAMVRQVIKTVDSSVNYKEVIASRGKVIRAEPIAALYEQGKVSHVGRFQELEDQMTMFTTSGFAGSGKASPDRVDALVWALTELMLKPQANAGMLLRKRHRS